MKKQVVKQIVAFLCVVMLVFSGVVPSLVCASEKTPVNNAQNAGVKKALEVKERADVSDAEAVVDETEEKAAAEAEEASKEATEEGIAELQTGNESTADETGENSIDSDQTDDGGDKASVDSCETEGVSENPPIAPADAKLEERNYDCLNAGVSALGLYEDVSTYGITSQNGVTANIAKRSEWTDKNTGEAKVTLNYSSDSGTITGIEDMNVILIQDKSGSMDSNYGLKYQMYNNGWTITDSSHTFYFPIQNTKAYSENAADIVQDADYKDKLNSIQASGINYPWHGKKIADVRYTWQSPCQISGHYYLLASDQDALSKGYMADGKNFYNISHTDLHQYEKLEDRDAAIHYLEQGRRVVKASGYYDEAGQLKDDEAYYLDLSRVVTFNGKEYLASADTRCEQNDRLAKSTEFMTTLLNDTKTMNSGNMAAYIPFWGDVPQGGVWTNSNADESNTGLAADTMETMSFKEGATALPLANVSTDFDLFRSQIQDPFTFAGTNYTRAFQKAIDYMESADTSKNTLVVFLTDGEPQGTAGTTTDGANPAINGANINILKKYPNTTVYSCGVCIQNDNSDVRARLNKIDSTGTGIFADTTDDFDALLSTIEDRINATYTKTIEGTDAIYTDELNSEFSFDTSQCDLSWKIIDRVSSSETKKGVPKEVYNTFWNQPAVDKVYVKSSHTVYWNIGTMTDGSFTEAGHSISFNAIYNNYKRSTSGAELTEQTNDVQKLTYTNSTNRDLVETVTTNTPRIIFGRQDAPQISVRKVLEGGTYKDDMTYKFGLYNSVYKSGAKVTDTKTVTIKAGAQSGETVFTELMPGTYYVYELDANDVPVSENVVYAATESAGADANAVTVSETPEILTKEKSETIPASATASDGSDPANSNNVLMIATTNGAITVTGSLLRGDLTITKRIKASDSDIWWAHGNPTFVIQLTGTGIDGIDYTFSHTFEFTKEYVHSHSSDGYVAISHTFNDIPVSEAYVAKEVVGGRYRLTGLASSNAGVTVHYGVDTAEFSGITGTANLKMEPTGINLTFENEKTNYGKFSHNSHVVNVIPTK